MARAPSEYVLIWAFRVRPGEVVEFERLYGPDGDWARLFERADGFLGTELWRDAEEPLRYVTVDRWRARADWLRFRATFETEYAELDARGARLTESETRLAALDPVAR